MSIQKVNDMNIFFKIKEEMKKQCVTEDCLEVKTGIPQSTIHRIINNKNKNIDLSKLQIIQSALGIAETTPVYAVSKVIEGLTPEEAEAIRIMRECPEALSVVRMMGAVDSDTQKDIQRIAETEKRTFEKLQQLQDLKKA
jgi:transcriptional regulator with XRE-family HTH domain